VQLVARLASGASSKTNTVKTFHPMRIPAKFLSAQRFLVEQSFERPSATASLLRRAAVERRSPHKPRRTSAAAKRAIGRPPSALE
jgi:hypothetical protein